MPTPDRLAPPPLPANPSQLQSGAYAFWLHCMPCHGDQGQGLTLEFRQLHPEDHRNCWASGCHGAHPYPDGWTLLGAVPALIGPGSLDGFGNAAALQAFVQGAMAFQDPGSLDSQTDWAVTAYLAQARGAELQGITLDPSNAPGVPLRGVADEVPKDNRASQPPAVLSGRQPGWA
jgi:cytochrome c